MAFVLNADPTSAAMNSYVSLSDANDYFEGNFTAQEFWSTLTDSQKNAALRQATIALEGLNYSGFKTETTQPLQHPRKFVYDKEGNQHDPLTVIKQVQYATCEMAYWVASEADRLMSDVELRQFKSYNVGPLNLTPAGNQDLLPQAVSALLNQVSPGFFTDPTSTKFTYAIS